MQQQKWAYFDFDDTLFMGDSVLVWNRFLYQKRPLLRLYGVFHLFLIPWVGLRIIPRMTFKRLLHLPAGTLSATERKALAREFVWEVVPHSLYPEIQRRIQTHKDNRDKVAILSASADFYLPNLASSLGADFFKGTPMHFKNKEGSIWNPPHFSEPNFKGIRKVEFIKKSNEFPGKGFGVASYSDHHTDIPLLKHAQKGIAVNPNGKMRREAEKNNWEIVVPTLCASPWKYKLYKLRLFLFGWL